MLNCVLQNFSNINPEGLINKSRKNQRTLEYKSMIYGTRMFPACYSNYVHLYVRIIPHVYRKVLSREGEHVYIVNADRWPRLAYIYSVHAFILVGAYWRGRSSLVWKMCVQDFTAMYRVSRIIQVEGRRRMYSSCTDLTKPRHGPSPSAKHRPVDRSPPSLPPLLIVYR